MKTVVNTISIDDLAQLARAAGAQVVPESVDEALDTPAQPPLERRSGERRGRQPATSSSRRPLIPVLRF